MEPEGVLVRNDTDKVQNLDLGDTIFQHTPGNSAQAKLFAPLFFNLTKP